MLTLIFDFAPVGAVGPVGPAGPAGFVTLGEAPAPASDEEIGAIGVMGVIEATGAGAESAWSSISPAVSIVA